jgi:predicted transcriptional regulator
LRGQVSITFVKRATTIQISVGLKAWLRALKLHPKEPYAHVIDRLIEDAEELSPQTRRDIAKSLRDFKAGRFVTLEEVERKTG